MMHVSWHRWTLFGLLLALLLGGCASQPTTESRERDRRAAAINVDLGLHYLSKAAEEAWQKEKDPKREKPKLEPGEQLQPWGQREERALKESIPGALLKVKVDLTHPLAWGLHGPEGAALNTSDLILEASPSGENPIFYPKEPLRLAGLLPSALEPKLQQTSYALRERKGKGALILFSGDPLFRGSAPFTTRAFLNAIFFGGYAPPEDED